MPDDPYAAYQQPDPYAAYQSPESNKGGDPKTIGGFLGNVASSAGNVASQVGHAVLHPIDTGTDIAKLGMGALEKGVRPVASAINRQVGWVGDPATGSPEIPKTSEEQQLDAALAAYKQRYGGAQNIADTLYSDPVGAALDASAVLGGGGALLKGGAGLADAANASRVAGALRTGASAANKAAIAVNPVVQGTRGAIAAAPMVANVAAKIPGAGLVGKAATAIQDRLTPFDPHTALIQAIKPRSSKLKFRQILESAGPDIKAAETVPITDTQTALDTIKQAKTQNRAAYDQFRGPANQMGTTVDLSPVADHMDASIPTSLEHEAQAGVPNAVAAVKSLKDTANAYRTQIPLDKAEKLLQEANAELDSYYAKYPREQWSKLETNPDTAATYAKAEALRHAIYEGLDASANGAGPRELQRRYGALLDTEQELQRRHNVAARQQPVSLAQQIGTAKAAGNLGMAAAKAVGGFVSHNPKLALSGLADAAAGYGTKAVSDWLKEQQTTDNLIKRAFAEYQTPPRPFPQPTPVNAHGGIVNPGAPIPTYHPGALGPGPKFTPPPADTSGTVPNAPPPAPAFRTGFPASAPKQLGPATPAAKQRGTPQPYNSSPSARAAPAPGAPFPVQKIYSEQEVRQIASQAGKNPDAAVELAKKHGILKPENFLDVEPIQ